MALWEEAQTRISITIYEKNIIRHCLRCLMRNPKHAIEDPDIYIPTYDHTGVCPECHYAVNGEIRTECELLEQMKVSLSNHGDYNSTWKEREGPAPYSYEKEEEQHKHSTTYWIEQKNRAIAAFKALTGK